MIWQCLLRMCNVDHSKFSSCALQLRVISNEAFQMLDKIRDENLAAIAKRTEEDDEEEPADVVFPQQFL